MRFTANQSLKIISGELAPPNNMFIDLVAQIALEKSIEFFENPKETTIGDNATEEEQEIFDNYNIYLEKFYNISESVIKNHSRIYTKLLKIVVTQFSANFGYAGFNNATENGNDNFWETKTTEVMTRSLELLAGIRKKEKISYEIFKEKKPKKQ